MSRPYQDRIVDETDGFARYDIIDRNNAVVSPNLSGIRLRLASTEIAKGDRFGAASVNRVLELDDDGTPLLAIDSGSYTSPTGYIKHRTQDTTAELPNGIRYGEIVVAKNGRLVSGNESNAPVLIPRYSDLSSIESALSTRITKAQNDANTANSAASTARSRAETAITNAATAQARADAAYSRADSAYSRADSAYSLAANALPQRNAFAYNFTANTLNAQSGTPQITWKSDDSGNSGYIQMGNDAAGSMVYRLGGTNAGGQHIFQQGDGAPTSLYASAYNQSSSKRYKKNIQSIDKKHIDAIRKLKIKEFDRIDDENHYVGIIAEDVAKIDSDFVLYVDGTIEGIINQTIEFAHIAYSQELERRIEELEKRI